MSLTLPPNLVTKASKTESWQSVEWADDSVHILLQHNFDGRYEYILVDRENIVQSINLSNNLAVGSSQLSLRNQKFDQYYIFDAAATTLKTASLASLVQTLLIDHVLSFMAHGSDTVLFVTDTLATAGNVQLNLLVGNQSYTLRSIPASGKYLLNLTTFEGKLYVAASNVVDSKVYVYKDPVAQLKSQPTHVAIPTQTLRITNPTLLSFSPDPSQYLIAENGTQFNVFDLKNRTAFKYQMNPSIDTPQTSAVWINANHLSYVSNGKLMVFDFDGSNQQSLATAGAKYVPVFSSDYKYFLSLSANSTGGMVLTQTSLIAAKTL